MGGKILMFIWQMYGTMWGKYLLAPGEEIASRLDLRFPMGHSIRCGSLDACAQPITWAFAMTRFQIIPAGHGTELVLMEGD